MGREHRLPDNPGVTMPGRARGDLGALAVVAVTAGLGALYAFLIEPGLPSDEPAHWLTVLYYAEHWSIPVMGHPGVTYEAQQGPVTYLVDAVFYRIGRAAGLSLIGGLRLVRLVSVAELTGAALLLRSLFRWTGLARLATPAALLLGSNPMLLTMSASVQNDTPALVLVVAALALAAKWRGHVGLRRGLVLGLVIGLAILTKLTTWPLLVTIPTSIFYWERRRAITGLAGSAFVIALLDTWWFVRNLILYGDPTGRSGVARTGVVFPAFPVTGIRSVGHLAEQMVTYLWLPDQYVRNTMQAPAPVKATIGWVTGISLLTGVYLLRRERPGPVAGTGALGFLTWILTDTLETNLGPRTAYPGLPAWFALLSATVTVGRLTRLGAIVLLASLNIWTLVVLSRVNLAVVRIH